MNIKTILFAAIVALGTTAMPMTASVGGYRHGRHGSHGHSYQRSYSGGHGHHYRYVSSHGRHYRDTSLYGRGFSIRLGPVVIHRGSSRGRHHY